MAHSHTGPFPSVPPALQEASQLSLVVVDVSQKTRRNKAVFRHLANNASEFVDEMINCYQIMEPYFPLGVPEDLAVVFQLTVNSLKYLRNFTRRVASRNIVTAFLFSRSDVKEIKAHEHKLAMNKGSFKMISNAYLKIFITKLPEEELEALKQGFDAAAGVEEVK